jgi:hypothetical protein
MDPTGQYIVGTDGKPIQYTISNGNISWSSNTSADVQRVGNAMLQTTTGTESFNNMINAKHPISISINNLEQSFSKLGLCENRRPDTFNPDDIESSKITIFEKNILKQQEKAPIKYGNFSVDEIIGSVGGHEATHATDKQNIWQQILDKKVNDITDFFYKMYESGANRVSDRMLDEYKKLWKVE